MSYTSMNNKKTLLDRPATHDIRNFDRMTVELSKYMNEYEIDQCIEFMNTIEGSKWDINPSAEDCKSQMQIMFGKDRMTELVMKWSDENQSILTVFGKLKYRHKTDKTVWDGLDPTDNPDDYEKIYL